MRIFAKIVASIFSALVVLSATALIILFSIDFNNHKDLIEEQVEAVMGRQLTIHGDLDLSLSLITPRLHVYDVEYENADWGINPSMLEIGELQVDLDLARLPFDRVFDIRKVKLKDAMLHLERNKDGQINLASLPSEEEAKKQIDATVSHIEKQGFMPKGQPILPILHEVEIDNLQITYKDSSQVEEYLFQLTQMVLLKDETGEKRNLLIEGAASDVPILVTGQTGNLDLLFTDQDIWPFELSGDIAGLKVDLSGQMQSLRKAKGTEVDLKIASEDIKKLSAVTKVFGGFEVPDLGATYLTTNLSADDQGYLRAEKLDWSMKKQGGHQLSLQGTIGDVVALTDFELDSVAKIESLNQFLEIFGIDLKRPDLGQVSYSSKLRGGLNELLTLQDIEFSLLNEDIYSLSISGEIENAFRQEGMKLLVKGEVPKVSELSLYVGHSIPSLGEGHVEAQILGDLHGDMNMPEFNLSINKGQDVDLDLSGSVKHLLGIREFDVAYDLLVSDLGKVGKASGLKLPKWQNIRSHGELVGSRDVDFHLKDFTFLVQNSDLAGNAKLSFKQDIPVFEAEVTSQRIIMSDLRKTKAKKVQEQIAANSKEPASQLHSKRELEEGQIIAKPTSSQAKVHRISKEEIDLSIFKQVNAKLDMSIGRLEEDNLAISPLNILATLQDGDFLTQKLEIGDGQGHVAAGHLKLITSNGLVDTDIRLVAEKLNIDAVLSVIGYTDLIKGDVQLDLDVKAAGKSPHLIASDAHGHLQMAMANGLMNADSVESYFGTGAKAFTELFTGGQTDEGVEVYCFIADYPIEQGVMKTKHMLFDSAVSTITSEGKVDFGQEEIDLIVKPQGEVLGIGAALPLVISGDFNNVVTYPDPTGTVASLTGTVLSGMLWPFAVAGSVLPLGGEGSPCTGANAKARTQEAVRGDSIVDDIGSGVIEGVFGIFDREEE